MTLVFDKGCNSPENIGKVDSSQVYFIGAFSPYHYPGLCQVPLLNYGTLLLRVMLRIYFFTLHLI